MEWTNGITISCIRWKLRMNIGVTLSIDGARDIEARGQLSALLGEESAVHVYSWKVLLDIE